MSFGKFRTRETIGFRSIVSPRSFDPTCNATSAVCCLNPHYFRIAIQFQAVEEVVVFAWNMIMQLKISPGVSGVLTKQ